MNQILPRSAILLGAITLLSTTALAHGAPTKTLHCAPTKSHGGVVSNANRAATVEPEAPRFIAGTQVQAFADGLIYHLVTAPNRITDIALQPGENLVAVASGDTARWIIGDTTSGQGEGKRTHVLVKPYVAGLSTNLVITTDRRSYHIALTSGGGALSSFAWTYPDDELLALKRATAAYDAAKPVASRLSPEDFNFSYIISGDKPTWRPVRAFDDGHQTFIQLPATIAKDEVPPLFLVDAKGVAELVNYRLSGRYYVVDRIFNVAELRLGTKKPQAVRIERVAEGAKRGRSQ